MNTLVTDVNDVHLHSDGIAMTDPIFPCSEIKMLNESTCSLGEKPWNIALLARIILPRAERTPSEVPFANFLYLTLKVSHLVE